MPKLKKQCFIIGPMGDMRSPEPRLTRIKLYVMRPLLEEVERRFGTEYEVFTPFDLTDPYIMDDVIKSIDRADLVVADITGNNPNVMYELGISHSLGRPTIVVREDDAEAERTPFDIQAYRFLPINLSEGAYEQARSLLRETVYDIDRRIDDWQVVKNPVTSFYGVPITNISPAVGLAQGYYYNFLRPLVRNLIDTGPDPLRHIYEVSIKGGPEPYSYGLDVSARKDLRLHVIIPDQIELCTKDSVDEVRRDVLDAAIETTGRPYTCFARKADDGYVLIDIPTAASVMQFSIKHRLDTLKVNARPGTDEWREIEDEELERFAAELDRLINDEDRRFRQRVKVVRFSLDDAPRELRWLEDIWQD